MLSLVMPSIASRRQVHGIPPQLVAQGGELMVSPLPEGPLSQLKLMLSPRHYRETPNRGGINIMLTAHIKRQIKPL
ncbi:hypothetical protein XENOCAPTIV_002725 [Xenoophorus captivus]|uniref:Uncharacterized protein n=1 Tax=Xenoophorus captivus TaxID=1517983 RepID=A0ABV0Q8J5_9TELE